MDPPSLCLETFRYPCKLCLQLTFVHRRPAVPKWMVFVATSTEHMPTNCADLCETCNHLQDCQLSPEVIPTFKYAAGEKISGGTFAYAIKRPSMPVYVRRAYGRVGKHRDLTERLDDMEVMLKQLLVLTGSPPREKPVRASTKYARRLLDRARYFANLSSKAAAEPNHLPQPVTPSAQGLFAPCERPKSGN